MGKKRSKGVSIISISTIVISSLILLYIVFDITRFFGAYKMIGFPLLQILITSTFLLTGIFMFRLRNWARILFIIQAICMTIFLIVANNVRFPMLGPNGQAQGLSISPIPLLLSFLFIVFVYFFTRPKVKEQFK